MGIVLARLSPQHAKTIAFDLIHHHHYEDAKDIGLQLAQTATDHAVAIIQVLYNSNQFRSAKELSLAIKRKNQEQSLTGYWSDNEPSTWRDLLTPRSI